jgi:peptide/nickel transport system permease protein
LLRRLAGAALLAFVLVVVAFLTVQLVPGDPARAIGGEYASPQVVQQIRVQLGLTDPVPTQFAHFVGNLVTGELGTSFVTGQPVTTTISQRLPVTAELAGIAMLLVIGLSIPLGIAVAARERDGRRRWLSIGFTAGSSLAGATPEYITGTLLILVVSVSLGLLPAQGGTGLDEIILPAIAVSLAPAAVFARLVRNETASVLEREYVLAVRSKRLPAWRLYVLHVLPNVLTSVLTLGGLLLVALLGGTVVTENVFNIPGLGTEVVQAIQHSDYPMVQGIIVVLGVIAIGITIAVDVVLGIFDPRRLSR